MRPLLPVFMVLLGACSGTDDDGTDASDKDVTDDSSSSSTGDTGPTVVECGSEPATFETGTGADAFESLDDLDPVELVFGPQGGYHMVTAGRACHMDPLLTIQVKLVDEATGTVISDQSYLAPTYEEPDCCRFRPDMYGYVDTSQVPGIGGMSAGEYLDGKVVVFELSATDESGNEASDSVRVTVFFNED